MLLLLGKRDAIKKYISEFNIKHGDYLLVPYPNLHYSEFPTLIELIKRNNYSVIITQNKEFIDALLNSDLEFDVTTAYWYEEKLYHRDVTKELAKEMVYDMGLELR